MDGEKSRYGEKNPSSSGGKSKGESPEAYVGGSIVETEEIVKCDASTSCSDHHGSQVLVSPNHSFRI